MNKDLDLGELYREWKDGSPGLSNEDIINDFFLEENLASMKADAINLELNHEQSLLLNVELLGIISDLNFYLDNVNLGVVTDVQIIKDIKQLIEDK